MNKINNIIVLLCLSLVVLSCFSCERRNQTSTDAESNKADDTDLNTSSIDLRNIDFNKDVNKSYDKPPDDIYRVKNKFHNCFTGKQGMVSLEEEKKTEQGWRLPTFPGKHKMDLREYDVFVLYYEKNNFAIKMAWDSEGAISEREIAQKGIVANLDGTNLVILSMKKSSIIKDCEECYEAPFAYWEKNPHHIPLIRYYNRNFKITFYFQKSIVKATRPEADKLINHAFFCMKKAIDDYYESN